MKKCRYGTNGRKERVGLASSWSMEYLGTYLYLQCVYLLTTSREGLPGVWVVFNDCSDIYCDNKRSQDVFPICCFVLWFSLLRVS